MLNEREENVALWITLKWFYSQIASIQNHFLIRNAIAVICALYFVLNTSFQIAMALISLLYSRLKNKAILCFIDIANFEECCQRERDVNHTCVMNCFSEAHKDVWQSLVDSLSILIFQGYSRGAIQQRDTRERRNEKYLHCLLQDHCYYILLCPRNSAWNTRIVQAQGKNIAINATFYKKKWRTTTDTSAGQVVLTSCVFVQKPVNETAMLFIYWKHIYKIIHWMPYQSTYGALRSCFQ